MLLKINLEPELPGRSYDAASESCQESHSLTYIAIIKVAIEIYHPKMGPF